MLVMDHVARVRARVRVRCALGAGLAAGLLALQFPVLSVAQSVACPSGSPNSAVVTYQVNAKGQVCQAVYPNGTVVSYAYDNNGNRLSATSVPDTTPPSAPASVASSSLTSNSAVIGWQPATDTIAITGYRYSIDGGTYTSFASYPNGLTLDLSSLTPGSTYTVSVEAQDLANNIGAPTTTTFTLPPSAPGTPTASSVTGNSAKKDNTVNSVSRYTHLATEGGPYP